jgi:hypothetical protein
VLRGARADVTDFSYMTLMDTSVVKHNMLKKATGYFMLCSAQAVSCNILIGPWFIFVGIVVVDDDDDDEETPLVFEVN